MAQANGLRGTILVVDDEQIQLNFIRDVLEDAGYAVVTTTDSDCVGLIEQARPELILIDVRMPVLDGDMIVAIFREHPEILGGALVLLYSGLSEEQLATMVKNCGAAGFIQKSGDPVKLRSEIDSWLQVARTPAPAA